jgi:hypothetical protein
VTTPRDDALADLLTPTLGAEADVSGFDRPWRPWSLVMLSFFFGLVAAGGLIAVNWSRMGRPGRVFPTLSVAGLGAVLLAAGQVWAGFHAPGSWREAGGSGITLSGQVVAVTVSLLLSAPQRRLYQIYRQGREPQGSLLWPAVGAVAVGLPAEFLLRVGFLVLFSTLRL